MDALPHPIIIVTFYAKSTVDSAEEDRNRKLQFWEELEDLLLNHPDSSHIIIAGDCDVRLDPNIDPTHVHVGPNVISWSETNLCRSGVGSSLPFHRKVVYKEMTCQDPHLEGTEVTDYAISLPPMRGILKFKTQLFSSLSTPVS